MISNDIIARTVALHAANPLPGQAECSCSVCNIVGQLAIMEELTARTNEIVARHSKR